MIPKIIIFFISVILIPDKWKCFYETDNKNVIFFLSFKKVLYFCADLMNRNIKKLCNLVFANIKYGYVLVN